MERKQNRARYINGINNIVKGKEQIVASIRALIEQDEDLKGVDNLFINSIDQNLKQIRTLMDTLI